jgi:hypothetical protein
MKEPRWVTPFLRALERTGTVRVAAADAGIDWSTAYQRRKAHAEFDERWEMALSEHAAAKARTEAEEIEQLKWAPPSALRAAISPANAGEETAVGNGQVKRVGNGRWGKAKEKIFFEELAATANVRRAAAAAGVSRNAVSARRLKHPLFAAKWDAVLQSGKASIRMYLVEESKKTFDPDELDIGDGKPRVTIDQAIKIAQIGASKTQREAAPNPFEEEAAAMTPEETERLREKLLRKLLRLRDRLRREDVAEGWTIDEEHDCLIPPGWVKAAK